MHWRFRLLSKSSAVAVINNSAFGSVTRLGYSSWLLGSAIRPGYQARLSGLAI